MRIGGAILAGGRGRRMGGADKLLVPLAGQPLIAHAIARLSPQVESIFINANGDTARLATFGLTLVADRIGDFAGPLAGLHAALIHAAQSAELTHLVTVPADLPFLPLDLVARLAGALEADGEIAIAASGGRHHPVTGIWPVHLAATLEAHLATATRFSMMEFLEGRPVRQVEFATAGGIDPFFNINTPDDLATAERHLAA